MTHPLRFEGTPVTTLVDLLQYRAHHQATKRAYLSLVDGETEGEMLTYAALDRKARALAAVLQSEGYTGGRALLVYPSGLEYIIAFFGCLYAGVTAVPAYPPRSGRRSLERIRSIVTDADVSVVLGTRSILADLERRADDVDNLDDRPTLATDTLDDTPADAWTPPSIDADTLAFLQYTSGSTGTPKGVMVTHGNLLHNEELIARAFEMSEDSVVVGWLPLYHDMGLIGNVIQPLYAGATLVLMTPVDFLQQPIRWLRAIDTYGGTVSGGPDFAYDLCVRKVTPEQVETLDLSTWRLAFNGAEPVRAQTLTRFTEHFAPAGFAPEAFLPCYGLAEATLFVSGGPRTDMPRVLHLDADALAGHQVVHAEDQGEARPVVSAGRLWDMQEVTIVDPDTGAVSPPDTIGEVWISGGSVAKGYWQRGDVTRSTFEARVPGTDQLALRTGDLGFVQDDHLYITGRLKDLIIIRGRNHYPQDLEATAETAHPALRPKQGAAFSMDVQGEEQLVIVHEVRRSALRDLDGDAIIAAIRKAISAEHALQVHTVALLKTAGLPKTTSGKVQRRATRQGLLAGTLAVVAQDTLDAPAEPVHITGGDGMALDGPTLRALPPQDRLPMLGYYIHQQVAQALRLEPSDVDRDQPLGALGLDSLDVVELRHGLESGLDLTLPVEEAALAELTVNQLARVLATGAGADASGVASETLDLETFEEGGTRESNRDLFAKCDTDGGYFGAYRKAKDTYYTQPVLEGPIGPRMRFHGRDVITWSINNYLGLAQDDRIRERALETIREKGTWSPMGSRMLTGNTHRHMELEARLASYLQKESSIVWNFGYMGVMGTIASLVGPSDTVILDSLSHACIVDGARLAAQGPRLRVFRHNDLESLEEQLKAADAQRRGGILIVTEGVFGMSGDLAPLQEICALKNAYDARLFVDDAHGFGVMGATGAGTAEYLDCQDDIDLYFGTFAKSFAAIGGVTAGDEKVIDYIRYNARTNIFAKSLPMVFVEAVDAALDLIADESHRRDQVWHIARRLRTGMQDLGFDTGNTASPITPVYIPTGDESTATDAIRMLREDLGIFASAVTFPVVPKGIVLFRLTATAAHTDADVDETLEAFKALRDRMGLRLVTSTSS